MTALEGAPHDVTSNCVNPGYVRTPLVTKQIADQAKVHGIAEDQVVTEILLKESAHQTSGGARGSGVTGGLARFAGRGHGDRGVLHDGRRVERAMTGAAPQWVPTDEDIANARVTDFARFVGERTGVTAPDYRSLWQWSVDEPAAFWAALWDYFELGDRSEQRARGPRCPGRNGFRAHG